MSKELREEVREKLESLGDTPDEIADSLYKGGYRGVPKEPNSCPVAMFLHDKFDKTLTVQTAEVLRPHPKNDWKVPLAELPWPVRRFIEEFDMLKEHTQLRRS